MYLQHVTENKKTFWKFAFSIVFTCFKHPKLPICIKIPVTLLQIVYLFVCFVALRPKSTAMVIGYICITAISQNLSS